MVIPIPLKLEENHLLVHHHESTGKGKVHKLVLVAYGMKIPLSECLFLMEFTAMTTDFYGYDLGKNAECDDVPLFKLSYPNQSGRVYPMLGVLGWECGSVLLNCKLQPKCKICVWNTEDIW